MRKILLLLTIISSLIAQQSNIKFTHITTDNGLSQSNVMSILQDKYGFLWFGTFDGLNRYDGYGFTIFKPDLKDSNSLKSNSVTSLYEDKDGLIWIGTNQGLCYYDRNRNKFFSFLNKPNIPEGINEGEIGAIQADKNNDLWISSNKGLIKLDRQNNKFIEINKINSKYVYIDSHYRIWVGTITNGLYLLDPGSNSRQHFSLDIAGSENIQNYEIRSIKEDKNGILWVGTYGRGLAYMNFRDIAGKKLKVFSNDPSDRTSLSSNLILSLYPDENGLWIGTDNGGINFLPNAKSSFKRYQNNPDDNSSPNNNSIYSILKDKSGDLWFGTFTGGINYMNITNQAFVSYRKLAGNLRSLSNNTVRDFAEDKDGNIWLATDGGGLNLFNIRTNEFTHYNTSTTNLNRDALLTVYIDKRENIWVGSWDGGISLFNPNSKSFKSYTKENSSISSQNIFDIDEDSKGILWLSSTDGLIRFDPTKEEFRTYTKANAGLAIDHTEVLLVDSKDNILVGTTQGLSVFNPNTEKAINYSADPNNPKGLSTGFVLAIYEESPSVIWVGTLNGINKIDRSSNQIQKWYEPDGLPNNSIRGIQPDNSGNLWISTNKGLSRFSVSKNKFKNFTKIDGIQGNEYVINSFYKMRSGKLLFGGVNGFDIFDPSQVKDNTFIPPVVVTDFQIFNKSVIPGDPDSQLEKNISETSEVELSYKESVFSLSFTALNFRASDKNEYAYMMEGFDSDWNYVGSNRTASYTNLDPGEYTFKVKASNNDGIWNETGTSLKIIISPPFWSTWWFRTLIFLIIAGIIYKIVERAKEKRKSLEEINNKLAMEIKHSKEAEEEKTRLAEEARIKDEEIKTSLQKQQDYLKNGFNLLLSEMNEFAEGNLNVNIKVDSEDSFSRLFTGFNITVNNLRQIILNLSEAIESTANASDHINITAEKILEGTNEQSARSEEVVAAVTEMTANILESSKNSEMAARASVEAKKIAEQGGEIVKQTIDGMNEISEVIISASDTIKKLGESSNEISQIIELIQDIADQTNLLALNAAIEAARAGEHGRGFAVVADEVQKLSDRTSSATKNIASMIKQIQEESVGAVDSISQGLVKVNKGKNSAELAGKSLDQIINSVSQVSQVIEQVALANEENSATAEHIDNSIEMINNVSKDNAERAAQVTNAVAELKELTGNLQELINRFKIN
ncbi:MAG: hypothetical protein GXX85_05745 [Ignavibacteria bacterium]|nr:hypothetical protein [Ignavibacteria bacterium]